MGRCISANLVQTGYYVAKNNWADIPYTGRTGFPLDPSKWSELEPLMVRMLSFWIELKVNFIDVIKEMKMTDAEYALLKVIAFFTPEKDISENGVNKIAKFRLKYIEAFNHVIYHSNKNLNPAELTHRTSTFIGLLTVIESVHAMMDAIGCISVMFDWASLNGSLAYDLYFGGSRPKN